jgi:hypothetical protein
MVERRRGRSCHAGGVPSAGRGARNWTARPTPTERMRGSSFAPAEGAAAAAGSGVAAWAADAEARRGWRWRRGVGERWGEMGRERDRELGEGWS